ncbi:MAG: SUMF1/EgtB/PvdO family nonheme iron enzyme [Candidatus Wallbacteria bacterium]|nr:SUMF1/EgtB/PvdO family nonheme iron enzyme [Candidatus Wallbacteria bacterium]
MSTASTQWLQYPRERRLWKEALDSFGLEVFAGGRWPPGSWWIFSGKWEPGRWWAQNGRLGREGELYYDTKSGLPLQYRRVADGARMVLLPEQDEQHPPMLFDVYPVTVQQFWQVMGKKPLTPVHAYQGGKRLMPRGGSSIPAHTLDLRDLWDYATDVRAQLPRREEWRFAARGTSDDKYPWGNQLPTARHANLGGRRSSPDAVDAKPLGESPFGVRDMAGNTEELCDDMRDRDGGMSEASYVTVCGGTYKLAAAAAGCDWSEEWRYTSGPRPRPLLGLRCCIRLVRLILDGHDRAWSGH